MSCRHALNVVSHLLTVLVAVAHLAFAYIEAVAWETKEVVDLLSDGNATKAAETKVMAQNQGAYNLGVAIGLLYGTVHGVIGIVQAARAVRRAMGPGTRDVYASVGGGSSYGAQGASHHRRETVSQHVQGFLLLFVVAMAAVGAATASFTILYVQGAPAALALLTVLARIKFPHQGFNSRGGRGDLVYEDF